MSDFWKLLVFFWTNRKELLRLLEALPDVLEAVGTGMEIAGASAVEASRYVRGDSTGVTNARSALETGATIIESIQSQVDFVKQEINGLAGNDFLAIVAPQLLTLSLRVQEASNQVQILADAFNDASSALDSTGTNLKTLGQRLESAGGQLRQIT
jgi:hypothetical protein